MAELRNSSDRYRTIYQQDQQRAESSSSTATRVRACAREADEAAMLHGQYVDCCDYFSRSFHRSISPGIQRAFAERIRDGMSADVIRAAIDDTMRAPRPSWAYCEAILKNLDLENVKTLKEWNDRKSRYQTSSNPALNYQQREYHEDEFGEDFFFDVMKYCPGDMEAREK